MSDADVEIGERLATLETKVEHLEEHMRQIAGTAEKRDERKLVVVGIVVSAVASAGALILTAIQIWR